MAIQVRLREAATTAAVLGNSARLQILQLLFNSRPLGLVVGDIQKAVNVPGSTLSHHLERLRAAGLVAIRRHGTFIWYLPNEERVRQLAGFLVELAGVRPEPEPLEAALAVPPKPEVEIECD